MALKTGFTVHYLTYCISGMMGPTSSDDSKLLAKFAETRHLPYISYTASAPELSDAEMYPNFMRTVAQDGPLTQVSSIKP